MQRRAGHQRQSTYLGEACDEEIDEEQSVAISGNQRQSTYLGEACDEEIEEEQHDDHAEERHKDPN